MDPMKKLRLQKPMGKTRTFIFGAALAALAIPLAQAQRDADDREQVDESPCPAGQMLWQVQPDDNETCAKLCTSDDDCDGYRCRVLGLWADSNTGRTMFADDIRDQVLEMQALVEASREAPVYGEEPEDNRADYPNGRKAEDAPRPMPLEPAMPLMACEPEAVERMRLDAERGVQ
jgi:hypothetical protein